jgi:hypothetical protein
MGGNERGCCKSKDEELGEHVCLWWGSLKELIEIKIIKIVS